MRISSYSMVASVCYFPSRIYNGCARVSRSVVSIAKRVFTILSVFFRAIGSTISTRCAWLKAKVSKKTPVQTANIQALNTYLADIQNRQNLSNKAMVRVKKHLHHTGKTPYDKMTPQAIVEKITTDSLISEGIPASLHKLQVVLDFRDGCYQLYNHWFNQFRKLGCSDERACMLSASIIAELTISFSVTLKKHLFS